MGKHVRVLRLRGLPFTATETDIAKFFSAWNVEEIRLCQRQGKPTGEGIARFATEAACTEALAQRDKQMLGKRYIELFRAKDQDLIDVPPSEAQVSGRGNVIRMRGLPFSACCEDIVEFFRGVPSVDSENIFFVYDGSGRPSGEAYITFASGEACNIAMKKHKHKMGARYIELFISSPADVQRAAKQRKLRAGKPESVQRACTPPRPVEGTTPPRPMESQSGAVKAGTRGSTGLPAKPVPAATAEQKSTAMAKPMTKTFASITASPPGAAAEHSDGSTDTFIASQMSGMGLGDCTSFSHLPQQNAVCGSLGAMGNPAWSDRQVASGCAMSAPAFSSMQGWGVASVGLGGMESMWTDPWGGQCDSKSASYHTSMWQPVLSPEIASGSSMWGDTWYPVQQMDEDKH